ncbi:hypothetical protein, partial [Ruminococcus flavefaciens]|uniref:hypothetical protein n=1 Tax=Ruminococcus flavefaciens TaxID=1265 RepID=UPI000474E9DF
MNNYENMSTSELIQSYNDQAMTSDSFSHEDHTDYSDHCDYDDSVSYVDSDSFGGSHDDAAGDLSGWGFG